MYETVEFSSNSDGTFAVSLAVPAEVANGTYYIRAEQIRSGDTAPSYFYNRFLVGPAGDGSLLPTTGSSMEGALNVLTMLGLALLASVLASRGFWPFGGENKQLKLTVWC